MFYKINIFLGSVVLELELGSLDTLVIPEKQRVFYAQNVKNKTKCSMCWCRYLCSGGCHVAAVDRNNDINNPDSIECEIFKMLAELAIIFISELKTNNEESYLKVKKYIINQKKVEDIAYHNI